MKSSENTCSTRARLWRAALAVASVIVIAGCSGGSDAPDAGPAGEVDPHSPEVSSFTIAGYQNAGTAPLEVATEAGLLSDYGIDVTLQPAENAPAMLAQIIGGDVPIAQVNGFFSIPAVLQGADLRVIGELIREAPDIQSLETLPDSGIESLADLEGKKVAVVGLNSGHHARVAYAMLEEGLDPSKVEFVSLGFNEMAPALEQGTVDAAIVTGPGQTYARDELGSVKLLDLGAGPFDQFPAGAWLVNGAWADENPNTVAAFQCAAVVGGQTMASEDQAAYEAALAAYGYSPEAIAADQKFIFPAANEPSQIIPDMMFELGWLDAEFDMSEITVPLPDNC